MRDRTDAEKYLYAASKSPSSYAVRYAWNAASGLSTGYAAGEAGRRMTAATAAIASTITATTTPPRTTLDLPDAIDGWSGRSGASSSVMCIPPATQGVGTPRADRLMHGERG